MNNEQQSNNFTPIAIIGLVLVVALIGGWWFYSNPTSPGTKKNSNTNSLNAAELYAKAAPGANPPNYLGVPNAAVTIEEFADFQCPTCAGMHPKVQELRAAYGDRIRIIFREFPLTMHPHGYDAACAAEAAGMQGKFWEMQNLLFSNQQTWANAPDPRQIFQEYAQKIGLDPNKFSDDMISLAAKNRVDKDLERGRSLNVNATPSFYINGKPVADLSVESMRKTIDAELQKAQSSQANTQTQANTQVPANAQQ